MKWSLVCSLFIVVMGVALVAAAPASGKAADAPEKFNLADLADGESRTFGEGDHAITATRKGDEVTITLRGHGAKGGKETFACTVGKDHCYVMARGEDGKGQVVVLNKSESGKDGKKTVTTRVLTSSDSAGEQKIMVFAGDDDDDLVIKELEPGMKWVTSQVDLDGESGEVVIHSDGEGLAVVTTDVSETEPGTKVVRIVAEGGTVLRCPEGDATLVLKKGEEKTGGPYFCPRHNLKMEPSKEPVIIKEKVKVEKKSGSHAEEY